MGGISRVAAAIWNLLRRRGFARTLGATMVTLGGALVIGSTFLGWVTLFGGSFTLYGVAFQEGGLAAALAFAIIPVGASMHYVERRTLRRGCALCALLIGLVLVIVSIATLLTLEQSSARALLGCFEKGQLGCPAGIPSPGRPLPESEAAEIRDDIAGEAASGPGLGGMAIASAMILMGGTVGVAKDRLTSRYPSPANDSDVDTSTALRRALTELMLARGSALIGAAMLVVLGGGLVAAMFTRPWVASMLNSVPIEIFGVRFFEGGLAFCLGLGVVPAGVGLVVPSNRSLRRFMALGSMLTGVALALTIGSLLLDLDDRTLEVLHGCAREQAPGCPRLSSSLGETTDRLRSFSSVPAASVEPAVLAAAVASGMVVAGGAVGVARERTRSEGSSDAPDRMAPR